MNTNFLNVIIFPVILVLNFIATSTGSLIFLKGKREITLPENENSSRRDTSNMPLSFYFHQNYRTLNYSESAIKLSRPFKNDSPTASDTTNKKYLTPVDLTKEFAFDDAEEIATASYTPDDIEKMKDEIDRILETDRDHANTTQVTQNTTKKTSNLNSFRNRVQKGFSYLQDVISKPLKVIKNAVNPATFTTADQNILFTPANASSNVMTLTAGSTSDMIMAEQKSEITFPDPASPISGHTGIQDEKAFGNSTSPFLEVKPNLSDVNKSDLSDHITFLTEIPNSTEQQQQQQSCKPNEVIYQSTCEELFSQGPCESGKYLMENEASGKIQCQSNPCPDFPLQVFFEDKCVMRDYFKECPEGMHLILEKTGQAFCDCQPGYIYFKETDECYEAFTQGPCEPLEFLILEDSRNGELNSKPTCVQNPCRISQFVCIDLQSQCNDGVHCLPLNDVCQNGTGILKIDEKTLQPTCQIITPIQSLDPKILAYVPPLTCAKGSKRDITGKCKKEFLINFS